MADKPIAPLGKLRLARLSDADRVGLVAAAAFHHASFFRQFYRGFAEGTVTSYRAEYQEGILDPDRIVVVAVAKRKADEIDSACDAIQKIYPKYGRSDHDGSGEAIVGVMELSLEYDFGRCRHTNFAGTSCGDWHTATPLFC